MEKTTKLLLLSVGAILIFAVTYFLFSTGDGGITGFQALGLLGYGFWIPVIICALLAAALGTFAVTKAKKDWQIIVAIIVAAFLLFSPWGKACTVKADPVQAPKYQPK